MESLEAIKEKTYNVVLNIMPHINREELLDDRDIFSLGLDSINAMMLILNLQDAFGLAFDASEISFDNFRTLAKIVELIKRKKEAYMPL